MAERSQMLGEILLEKQAVKRIVSSTNAELVTRKSYRPPRCRVFKSPFTALEEDNRFRFHIHEAAKEKLSRIIGNRVQRVVGVENPDAALRDRYGRRRNIGIVFSGGPAPGGHNVIAGIFDAAKAANPQSRIYGFLLGPDGVIENEAVELTAEVVDAHRNLGGFTMIKTGRTKIDTKEKVTLSRKTCKDLALDALVIVGGDDSNTNAAFLAQEMMEDGVQVIGVPKTIDGDIQVRDADGKVLCAMSFGFHTAARAFAWEVSNLCTDSGSDVKYWHICKVMGRVASHLALEVALQTHPNITLIGEDLADYLERGASVQKRFPGLQRLRHDPPTSVPGHLRRDRAPGRGGEKLRDARHPGGGPGVHQRDPGLHHQAQHHHRRLQPYPRHALSRGFPDACRQTGIPAAAWRGGPGRKATFSVWNSRDDDLFADIPEFFQEGLLTERDSHGNFQFSQVETDKVLIGLVKDYLNILKEKGEYKIGIERGYYRKTLAGAGLDPDRYGPVLFKNYGNGAFLLMKEAIFSVKTLRQVLVKEQVLTEKEEIPKAVKKIFDNSVPKFKTQLHFYGYDGRGADPTRFDCIYTYNLGLTVFSLSPTAPRGRWRPSGTWNRTFPSGNPSASPSRR